MDGLQWKIQLKLMIWGYPLFEKPPKTVPPSLRLKSQICGGSKQRGFLTSPAATLKRESHLLLIPLVSI
jgi:hypothetical protein